LLYKKRRGASNLDRLDRLDNDKRKDALPEYKTGEGGGKTNTKKIISTVRLLIKREERGKKAEERKGER